MVIGGGDLCCEVKNFVRTDFSKIHQKLYQRKCPTIPVADPGVVRWVLSLLTVEVIKNLPYFQPIISNACLQR